jgi:SAM-dependent methyltransferase
MVTLPSEPPAPPQDAPHRHREIAESFGLDAERYDRARPRYPLELAASILAGIPGREILDVGIGTGISAIPFRELGADVRGVEIDPRMAAIARDRGFEVDVAAFEDWEPRGHSFDAVIAGQTWHWIDPVRGASKAAEVLKPAGWLALFWNVGDPDPELAAAFAEVYRRVDTGLPFTPWQTPALGAYEGILTKTIDGISGTGAFDPPGRMRFDWQTTVTRDHWLDQVPTAGGHNRIPKPRLDELLDGMAAVIDEVGGTFTMTYATVAVTARRRSDR